MRVAIRADGNTDIGYGHLFRSNTVATELKNSNVSITYLTKTPDQVRSICLDEADIIRIENRGELIESLKKFTPDGIYIDLPDAPVGLQQSLRDEALLAVFLGSARSTLACDILVNGHFFAEDEVYEWIGEEPVWCLGPDYLPLRQPFPSLASRSKKCSQKPERGIILMGGSDPHNLTPTAMTAFEGLDMDIVVVVGPGNKQIEDIERTQDLLDGSFDIQRDPDDLPMKMFDADIAVSGFGTTAYELMATKTPFVGVTRTELERVGANKISNHVAIPYVDSIEGGSLLTRKVRKLVLDYEQRQSLQSQFSEVIDGNGASRIANELLANL